MPTITEKFIAGYAFNEAGDPIVGATVTANLSDRIVRTVDNLVVEIEGSVTAPTDGTGRWVMALHPNNQPGDAPQGTHWTITEPGGHTEDIQIVYNASGGGTDPTALSYTSLVTTPANIPSGGTSLQSQIDTLTAGLAAVNTELGLMNNLNAAGLAALTPPVPTTLVDAAAATSGNVTTSVDGLMLHTDKAKLDSITVANLVTSDPVTTTGGVVLPSVARPTTLATGASRVYRNSTSGEVEVAVNVGGTIFYSVLGPGLESPAFQITTDFTLSSTTMTTVNASTPLNIVANALYFISAPIAYTAQGQYDVGVRFSAIPNGATLRWGAVSLTSAVQGAAWSNRPPPTPAGAGGVGYIDAGLRTGTNEMLFPGQGVDTSLLAGQTQSPLGAVSVYIYGTLRTGVNAGGINFQARRNDRVAGGTINPLILAGTSVTLTRVA
jgi:hypothetical protein